MPKGVDDLAAAFLRRTCACCGFPASRTGRPPPLDAGAGQRRHVTRRGEGTIAARAPSRPGIAVCSPVRTSCRIGGLARAAAVGLLAATMPTLWRYDDPTGSGAGEDSGASPGPGPPDGVRAGAPGRRARAGGGRPRRGPPRALQTHPASVADSRAAAPARREFPHWEFMRDRRASPERDAGAGPGGLTTRPAGGCGGGRSLCPARGRWCRSRPRPLDSEDAGRRSMACRRARRHRTVRNTPVAAAVSPTAQPPAAVSRAAPGMPRATSRAVS